MNVLEDITGHAAMRASEAIRLKSRGRMAVKDSYACLGAYADRRVAKSAPNVLTKKIAANMV
jgi:hypothetical protein